MNANSARTISLAKCYRRSGLSVLINGKSNWRQNKYGDCSIDQLSRVPPSMRTLSEESIRYITSVFQVLQSCDARRLAGKFYVTDHSSNVMSSCHKAFAVVRTSSYSWKQHLEVYGVQIVFHNYITVREQNFNKLKYNITYSIVTLTSH